MLVHLVGVESGRLHEAQRVDLVQRAVAQQRPHFVRVRVVLLQARPAAETHVGLFGLDLALVLEQTRQVPVAPARHALDVSLVGQTFGAVRILSFENAVRHVEQGAVLQFDHVGRVEDTRAVHVDGEAGDQVEVGPLHPLVDADFDRVASLAQHALLLVRVERVAAGDDVRNRSARPAARPVSGRASADVRARVAVRVQVRVHDFEHQVFVVAVEEVVEVGLHDPVHGLDHVVLLERVVLRHVVAEVGDELGRVPQYFFRRVLDVFHFVDTVDVADQQVFARERL